VANRVRQTWGSAFPFFNQCAHIPKELLRILGNQSHYIIVSIWALIALVFLSGLPLPLSASQPWIGSDDFNGPVLDPAKWVANSNFLIKTSSAISFWSNTSSGSATTGISWAQNLPVHENWSVTVEASISPAFATAGPNNFAEALLVIAANDQQSYFTNCLHRDDNFDIVPNWENNNSGNQELSLLFPENAVLLRMEFDASNQSITSSHASLSSPGNFTATQTLSTAGWQNLESFIVVLGLYTKDASIPSGQLTLDNFSIVPEPAPIATLFLGLGTLGLLRCTRSKCPAKESEG